MTIEQALFNRLSTFAGLMALIDTRVFPVRLPQGVILPAATYSRVSGPVIRTMQGGANPNPVFQVDCWAETYLAAKSVAGQVRDALDGFTGTLGGDSGVSVQCIYVTGEHDEYEGPPELYRTILEVEIWHG